MAKKITPDLQVFSYAVNSIPRAVMAELRKVRFSDIDDPFFDQPSDDTEDWIAKLLPPYWNIIRNASNLFHCRSVSPHVDDSMTDVKSTHTAFICLTKTKMTYLHVGNESCKVLKGDLIIFNHKLVHSIASNKIWKGVAIQLKRKSC